MGRMFDSQGNMGDCGRIIIHDHDDDDVDVVDDDDDGILLQKF